jgi:hypothetical protein
VVFKLLLIPFSGLKKINRVFFIFPLFLDFREAGPEFQSPASAPPRRQAPRRGGRARAQEGQEEDEGAQGEQHPVGAHQQRGAGQEAEQAGLAGAADHGHGDGAGAECSDFIKDTELIIKFSFLSYHH